MANNNLGTGIKSLVKQSKPFQLNFPSHKPTQEELNKEVLGMFKSREDADKWLAEQKDFAPEEISVIQNRFFNAFSK